MPYDLSKIDAGNTAWMLASAALVLLMTPGLAFFYGGMVRAKNVLGMLMQNFVCIGIVSVVWVLVSYSLAFGGSSTRSSAVPLRRPAAHERTGARATGPRSDSTHGLRGLPADVRGHHPGADHRSHG